MERWNVHKSRVSHYLHLHQLHHCYHQKHHRNHHLGTRQQTNKNHRLSPKTKPNNFLLLLNNVFSPDLRPKYFSTLFSYNYFWRFFNKAIFQVFRTKLFSSWRQVSIIFHPDFFSTISVGHQTEFIKIERQEGSLMRTFMFHG